MNTLIAGFIFLGVVLVAAVGNNNLSTYIQAHSIILVLGGTIAIFALSTPFEVIKSVGRAISGLFKKEESFSSFSTELNSLIKTKALSTPSRNALINYASELWSQGVDPELFIVLLSQKRSELEAKASDSVQALKNLSKYPPALGMIGTVMGMVQLFATLDKNQANIGSHLSLAMTATFFGLIVTNAILSPIADRVHVQQVQLHRVYASIYEILLLINRDEPNSILLDEVSNRAA